MAKPATIAKYMNNLKNEDMVLRREAARKLGTIGRREAIAPLCAALQDESWYVRQNAAFALGKIGDAEAVAPLCHALGDERRGVRRKAAMSLGRIGDHRALEPLCQALQDKSEAVRESATEALVKFGSAAIKPMCETLEHTAQEARHSALLALQYLVESGGEKTLGWIVAEAQLTPAQRMDALETLRGTRFKRGWLSWYQFQDIRAYCTQAAESPDATLRTQAKALLDYMTLARSSQPDPSEGREILLRAAHGAGETGGADILLRASDERSEDEEELEAHGVSGLFARVKRLFHREE